MDTDDSGVSVLSAPSTASSAKRSFSDELTGVRAFCMIVYRNIVIILEIIDKLIELPLSFERNIQHFHLIARTCRFIVQRLCDFDQPVVNVVFF